MVWQSKGKSTFYEKIIAKIGELKLAVIFDLDPDAGPSGIGGSDWHWEITKDEWSYSMVSKDKFNTKMDAQRDCEAVAKEIY